MTGSERESCASAPRSLAGAANLEPHQQGDLDYLCGLYAAINGLCLSFAEVSPLRTRQCVRLFSHGIRYLNERTSLPSCRRTGLTVALWHRLVVELAGKTSLETAVSIHPCRPFHRRPGVTIRDVVAFTESMIDEQSPVLLLLEATNRHFTVVSGYTPTRLRLFDSSGQCWVNQKSCSTADDADSLYRIHAGSLVALRL